MLRKMRLLETVEEETGKKVRKTEAKSVDFNMFFSIGLFAAVLLGGLGLLCYFYAGSLETIIDRELATEQHNEIVDQLKPAEVVTYYNELRIEDGLGDWYEPNYVRYNTQSTILTIFSYVLMGLGGASLVCALSVAALIASKR